MNREHFSPFIGDFNFFNTRVNPFLIKNTKYYNNTECWIWEDNVCPNGYGKLTYKNKIYALHRLVYVIFKGIPPEELVLDHLCRNRSCCNPDHLEPVTQSENVRRGAIGQYSIHINHCKKGHEYTEQNLTLLQYKNKDGKIGYKRRCKECLRVNAHKCRNRKDQANYPELEIDINYVPPRQRTRDNSKFPCGHEKSESNIFEFQHPYYKQGFRNVCKECHEESIAKGDLRRNYFKCGHSKTEDNLFRIQDKNDNRGYFNKCLICHDANLKGREKKVCINGHEYTEENTVFYNLKDGTKKKDCKQCISDRRNKAKQKQIIES